jgi:hypothetical protein
MRVLRHRVGIREAIGPRFVKALPCTSLESQRLLVSNMPKNWRLGGCNRGFVWGRKLYTAALLLPYLDTSIRPASGRFSIRIKVVKSRLTGILVVRLPSKLARCRARGKSGLVLHKKQHLNWHLLRSRPKLKVNVVQSQFAFTTLVHSTESSHVRWKYRLHGKSSDVRNKNSQVTHNFHGCKSRVEQVQVEVQLTYIENMSQSPLLEVLSRACSSLAATDRAATCSSNIQPLLLHKDKGIRKKIERGQDSHRPASSLSRICLSCVFRVYMSSACICSACCTRNPISRSTSATQQKQPTDSRHKLTHERMSAVTKAWHADRSAWNRSASDNSATRPSRYG